MARTPSNNKQVPAEGPIVYSSSTDQNREFERFARNLDWNLLRTFMVIVQEGSLTKAANRLFLQQPSISAALKRLEESIGHSLIDRQPGHFQVTPAGRKLYAESLNIFQMVSCLRQSITDAPVETTGHIRIATVSQVMNTVFDAILADFFKLHPKVTLSIEVLTTTDVIRSLEQNLATVGLCDGVISAGLHKRLLKLEKYAIYCGKSHRFFGEKKLQLNDLRGEPYITFKADILGGEHMTAVTAIRAQASIGQYVRGTSAYDEEVCRMIIGNVGIGALQQEFAAPYVSKGLLWQLPPYQELPETSLYFVSNPMARLNDAEHAFLEFANACQGWPG